MKYVVTETEVSPTNNPPTVVDYGDSTESDAIADESRVERSRSHITFCH